MITHTCKTEKTSNSTPQTARWGSFVKVPNTPVYAAQLKNLRDEYGEPMAVYFARGGAVAAFQWRVRGD